MKQKALMILVVGMLVLALGIVAAAQSGGGYDLRWSSVDGGGGVSSGGGYTLAGSIGQPDAGLLTGNGYTLGGGFWKGGVLVSRYELYLPCVRRGQ